jgi:urea transport system permease protein
VCNQARAIPAAHRRRSDYLGESGARRGLAGCKGRLHHVWAACLRLWPLLVAAVALGGAFTPALAITMATLQPLAGDDNSDKIIVVEALVREAHPQAQSIVVAMQGERLLFSSEGRFFIQTESGFTDALSANVVTVEPATLKVVEINNRIRGRLEGAIAAFDLLSPDLGTRKKAIEVLQKNADASLALLVERAYTQETNSSLKAELVIVRSQFALASEDTQKKLEAIRALGESDAPQTRALLLPFVEKAPDGSYKEADAGIRAAAERALRSIETNQRKGEVLGALFTGISLGSVLLLAALGLAITYGLMGVINMAHGEFLMIGAYATYVVQGVFRRYFPEAIDWYLIAALPFAFGITALVGAIMERTVIRFLYGRPLETLLATFGISLILIQIMRTLFGAQNVEVANPAWMSGGIQLLPNLTLPWNRVVILLFSVGIVALVWVMLNLTRLGLFVRGVTQNRAMASCVGIPTRQIDTLAFALGAGIAGLGGVALSQIGNVGPDLGQSYIIDSFMVVVLGGVGQLAGTVVGAFGLGVMSKFLEPFSGAVLAKIMVLVFIILFIQKRPQGLFALRGRSAE